VAILAFAALGESIFAIAGFAAPQFTLQQFAIQANADTLFLGYIVAWFLLFVAITAILALKQVLKNNPNGWTLSYILGVWWIGIGIGVYIGYGRTDNLFMDSLKGCVIILTAWRSRSAINAWSGRTLSEKDLPEKVLAD